MCFQKTFPGEAAPFAEQFRIELRPIRESKKQIGTGVFYTPVPTEIIFTLLRNIASFTKSSICLVNDDLLGVLIEEVHTRGVDGRS